MELLTFVREISILIGVLLAVYGIDAWRREHQGKRKIELAEETLALFYEARDAIADIRAPWSFGNETDSIERGDNETDSRFEARKNASVAFARYRTHSELFARIHSMRYRFMAQVGVEQSKPFEEINRITTEILLAARMLTTIWGREIHSNQDIAAKQIAHQQRYEAIFWEQSGDGDPLTPRVEKALSDIEGTCSKIIRGSGTLHGLLNLKVLKGRGT